jgi:hypothetical protein
MDRDELDNFPVLSSDVTGPSIASIKKDIDAVAKHSDLLTRTVHSSNKKLETLSKIVIGNGEVRQSMIWNLEGVKSEIFQISKNIETLTKKVEEIHSATTSKLDNITDIEAKILAIEKVIENKEKASDTFRGRYLAPILVAVTNSDNHLGRFFHILVNAGMLRAIHTMIARYVRGH